MTPGSACGSICGVGASCSSLPPVPSLYPKCLNLPGAKIKGEMENFPKRGAKTRASTMKHKGIQNLGIFV